MEKRVVVVAAYARRPGAADQREHPFGIGSAREQVSQEVERVATAETHAIEQPLGFVPTAVDVADDDGAAGRELLARHRPRVSRPTGSQASFSLARFGITMMPWSLTK